MRGLFRYLVEKQAVTPYIMGHITDGSSTFTFTVNENESVTVNVNSNGWWKWYVDRPITSLISAFENKTNIDELYLYKINLNIDCRSFFGNNGTNSFHIIDISKCFPITSGGEYTWFSGSSKCIIYLPEIKGSTVYMYSSMTQVFATKNIYSNINLSSTNGLIKENILSFINFSKNNNTYTLSQTIYAKCASGGEWYTDIQAAIDAKALEGYTVTLISV